MDEQMKLEEIFGNYFAWMAKPGTWFISFMGGSQFLYLLEGEEKALLIDTGYAIGNLRAFVEKLTNKPIEVINTHFHPDHAGGNGEWEKVYVSAGWKKDAKSILKTSGDPDKLPFPNYEKIEVGTGDVIDLGGRTIEIFNAKDCHSNSSLYLLDRKERLLFMGDEMDSWQVLLYDNSNDKEKENEFSTDKALRNYLENLEFVRSLDSEYDWLLGNHNGAPMDKSYIDDFEGLVKGVYNGETIICDSLEHKYIEMDPIASKLVRVRYKKASAFVFKDQLMELRGEKICM